MTNTYQQSWRQIYFNDLYLMELSKEKGIDLDEKKSAKDKPFFNIGLHLMLAFSILICSAFILNWFSQRLDYKYKDKNYNDIPAYRQDTDQGFLKEFLESGYIGMNKNKII